MQSCTCHATLRFPEATRHENSLGCDCGQEWLTYVRADAVASAGGDGRNPWEAVIVAILQAPFVLNILLGMLLGKVCSMHDEDSEPGIGTLAQDVQGSLACKFCDYLFPTGCPPVLVYLPSSSSSRMSCAGCLFMASTCIEPDPISMASYGNVAYHILSIARAHSEPSSKQYVLCEHKGPQF